MNPLLLLADHLVATRPHLRWTRQAGRRLAACRTAGMVVPLTGAEEACLRLLLPTVTAAVRLTVVEVLRTRAGLRTEAVQSMTGMAMEFRREIASRITHHTPGCMIRLPITGYPVTSCRT